MRHTIATLMILALLFTGCAKNTGETKTVTDANNPKFETPEQPKIDCSDFVDSGEAIRLLCSQEEQKYYLIADLNSLDFIDVSVGRKVIPGTEIPQEKKILLVGDFKPGWSQGIEGIRHGNEIYFDITLFTDYDGSHRTTIRVQEEDTWLFLEQLSALQLVTLTRETETKKEGICIGFAVQGGKILEFARLERTASTEANAKKSQKTYILPKTGFRGKNFFSRESETKVSSTEQ